MQYPTKTAIYRPDLHIETDGEFRGWRTWSHDKFENHNGPFYHRMEDDGRIRCVFRVEKKHLNGGDNVHGGCFMTFADYCLFAIAAPALHGPAVTVSFGCEFLDPAREGELIEGTGEITRAGKSMIFLRGLLKSGERPLCTFSGTIKRMTRRSSRATVNRAGYDPPSSSLKSDTGRASSGAQARTSFCDSRFRAGKEAAAASNFAKRIPRRGIIVDRNSDKALVKNFLTG